MVSFRIGSDGVRGDGEEGSRGLVLGCSNRRLPEGQAGGECVRRGVFGAARRYSNDDDISPAILRYRLSCILKYPVSGDSLAVWRSVCIRVLV